MRQRTVAVLSVLAVVSLGAGVAMVGFGTAAPDYTDEADVSLVLPDTTDHYPGDQNPGGASAQHFVVGEDALRDQGAGDGIYLDTAEFSASWIDHSACESSNIETFGIDRGNDNSGTETDVSLVQSLKQFQVTADGMYFDFYGTQDFGGDPPYLAPEDAIVLAVGDGSSGGPCLTMTSDAGWYDGTWTVEGTVADNGPDENPSDDADTVAFDAATNYVYVCECDSRQEAEEQLGLPPEQRRTTTPTATATAAPTATPTATPTPIPTTTREPTESTPSETDAPAGADSMMTPTAGEQSQGVLATQLEGLPFDPVTLFGGITFVVVIGLALGRWNDSVFDDEPPETTAKTPEALRSEAEEAMGAAKDHRETDEYDQAIDEYENAIEALERELERIEPDDTDRREGAKAALATVRESLAETEAKAEAIADLRDELETAESDLQSAAVDHIDGQNTAARVRYRQARDGFEDALESFGELDVESITVDPPVRPGDEPTLDDVAGLTESGRRALSEAGFEEPSDVASASPEAISEIPELDSTVTERVLALGWQATTLEGELTDTDVIAERREKAERGFKACR